MATHRIAVIPGDGIGQEVIAEGVKVLRALERLEPGLRLRLTRFGWGCDWYQKHGEVMPEDCLEVLARFDAIYLGAIGDPANVPDTIAQHALLNLRKGLDQYACVRPALLLPGVRSPLAGKAPGAIDFIVVRENTEGEYAGSGGRLYRGTPKEVAIQTSIFTRAGTERTIRFAFALARRRKRRRLTSVTKSNVQQYSMVFWDEVFWAVAREFPDVQAESMLVDAACMNFVRAPERFDVVVASNQFGDILTDIAAAIVGSLGLAPSANINPSRALPSMFEPVHGYAPDIAGQGIANPLAAILAAEMMLDFLGERRAARRIRRAVIAVLLEGKTAPADLGGRASTAEVGAAVRRHLRRAARA